MNAVLWQLLLLNFGLKYGLAQGFGRNLIKIPDEDRGQIVCTVALLAKYFQSGEPLSGSVLHMSITSASLHLQKSLLQALHGDPKYPWSIVVKEVGRGVGMESPDFVLHEKPQCYFMVIDNMDDEDIDDIFEIWKSNVNWNPLAQFVVYLSSVEETAEEMTDIMIELLLNFMNKKIYNVNVIGQNEEENYYYGKSVFPYHPDNNCGNRVITIETLDLCDYQNGDKDEEDEADEGEEGEEEENIEEDGDRNENEEGHGDGEGDGEDTNDVGETEDQEDSPDYKSREETSDTEIPIKSDGNPKTPEVPFQTESHEGPLEQNSQEDHPNSNEEALEEENHDGEQAEKSGGECNESDDVNPSTSTEPLDTEYQEDYQRTHGRSTERPKESDSQESLPTTRDGTLVPNSEEPLEEKNNNDNINTEQNTSSDEKSNGPNEESSRKMEDDSQEDSTKSSYLPSGMDEDISPTEVQDKTNENPNTLEVELETNSQEGSPEVNEIPLESNSGEYHPKTNEEPLNGGKLDEEFETPNGNNKEVNANPHSSNQNMESDSQENSPSNSDSLAGGWSKSKTNSDGKPVTPKGSLESSTQLSFPKSSGISSETEFEESPHDSPEGPLADEQNYEQIGSLEKGEMPTKGSLEEGQNYDTIRKESLLENSCKSPLPTAQPDIEYINITNCKISSGKSLPFSEEEEDSESPEFYIEEMYRALFLDKFPKDLSGCPLVAAYRPWEPYIFNEALGDTSLIQNNRNPASEKMDDDEDDNGDEDFEGDDDGLSDYNSYDDQMSSEGDTQMGSFEIHLNGIEYKMIQTIGERLHISIDMQVENTNVYHLFQQLIDGDIEMVIGGIDEDPSISQYVSSTIPYHQDDLTWCVAKARRSYNLFNFMATFDTRAWILTLLFILTASCSITMMQKLLKLGINCLKSYFSVNMIVMGVILGQAVNLPRIPTSLKLSFGATFFMGLIFSNVYQSFLISTLTTPKSSYQISHTDEIFTNRMNVMGSVDNVRHLGKQGETFRYVREHFHMCYNIEECLHRAAIDPKLAVAVSRQHSFYNPRIPRDSLYCFDRNENIYVYLVTMLLPKKFHLLHKINPVIQHIIESGHMQKWARDLDMRRKIIEEIQRAHEEPFKSLTIKQVVGPFAFSSILQIFAVFVFGMEHIVHWLVVRRRTRLKIAKYLHRKFV